jgi:hypothetical protein
MKKNHRIIFKILKIVSIVICSIGVLVAGALGGIFAFDSIKNNDYYKRLNKEFVIPGLNDNFTPQGLAYSSTYDFFLDSGYNSKNKQAEIYVISNKDKSIKKVGLTNNGKIFTSHAGGIAISNNKVFLSNTSRIFVLSLEDIVNAKNNERVNILSSFYVPVNSSFVFANEERLYVGEYIEEKGGYTTDDTHKITFEGTTYNGLIVSYSMDKVLNANNGEALEPDYGYSIPDYVQGCAYTVEGRLILSTSHGLSESHLLIYKNMSSKINKVIKHTKGNVEMEYNLDIYTLSDDLLEEDIIGPAMNEDLEYANGKLYVNNESASNKFIFGKFTYASSVYSLTIA